VTEHTGVGEVEVLAEDLDDLEAVYAELRGVGGIAAEMVPAPRVASVHLACRLLVRPQQPISRIRLPVGPHPSAMSEMPGIPCRTRNT
jgi:hypothetical protein